FGFFPLFFLLYFIVPYRWKNGCALLGSLFFYAWGGPKFVFVLLASITVDYFLALGMRTENGKKRRNLLIIGLILNVGLLAYFKYANFFVDNLNAFLGWFGIGQLGWTEVVLPIGISFFTFQKISYLVDVFRKVKEPLSRWTGHALFVILFPQLIAGPIVRFKEIADEIRDRRANLNYEEKLLGLFRFSIGLAKKVMIANPMGAVADGIFDKVSDPTGIQAWVAMIAYTFQIYFDFSGYSDMAIGLGRMMGFHFPENFNFPYLSKSITEFWRRWHITLSSWMRDYLYIPLGGNRKGESRTYINLWTVFLISGLWHGASWNFVIWGGYHGFWLVTERLFLMRYLERIPNFVRVFWTFGLAMVGWLLFRLTDLGLVGSYLQALLIPTGNVVDLDPSTITVFFLAMIFSFWNVNSWTHHVEKQVYSLASVHKTVFVASMTLLLFWTSAIGVISSDFNPFIYFRF
ncbi:MAG: MBOAT family protein, partial [Bacteroidota bacterium]|nr:MBOAT family protein [Bacteroidota bacterium]